MVNKTDVTASTEHATVALTSFSRNEWRESLIGVVLYGSYADGSASIESDIDGIVVLSSVDRPYSIQQKFHDFVLDIQVYDESSLIDFVIWQCGKRMKLLARSLSNGIVVLDTVGAIRRAVEQARSLLTADPPAVDWMPYRSAMSAQLDYVRKAPSVRAKIPTYLELYRCITSIILLRGDGWLAQHREIVPEIEKLDPAASARLHDAFVQAVAGREQSFMREAESALDSIGGSISLGEKCFV